MNQWEEPDMGVVIGVLVGYALGSRAGSGSWAELEEAWNTITSSEEVRDLVSGGLSMVKDIVTRRADLVAGLLGLDDELEKLRQAA
jgi:hypothetical protein